MVVLQRFITFKLELLGTCMNKKLQLFIFTLLFSFSLKAAEQTMVSIGVLKLISSIMPLSDEDKKNIKNIKQEIIETPELINQLHNNKIITNKEAENFLNQFDKINNATNAKAIFMITAELIKSKNVQNSLARFFSEFQKLSKEEQRIVFKERQKRSGDLSAVLLLFDMEDIISNGKKGISELKTIIFHNNLIKDTTKLLLNVINSFFEELKQYIAYLKDKHSKEPNEDYKNVLQLAIKNYTDFGLYLDKFFKFLQKQVS